MSTTVHAAVPSRSSKSRSQYPDSQTLSVLERRRSTDRRAYDSSSYLPSRVLSRATEEIHKCGTTESIMVRRDHDALSRDPSTLSVFIKNSSTTRTDKTGRYTASFLSRNVKRLVTLREYLVLL